MADLSMHRGDTRTATFTFAAPSTFEAGDVVRFTAKRRATDTDTVISRTSADGGITLDGATATTTILPADTNDFTDPAVLVFDWELTTAGGSVRTLDTGRITVTLDITR